MSRFALMVVALAAALGLVGWWWLTRDTTIYAPSYSERAFARVQVGMRLEEVHSLLGKPIAVRRGTRPETWCYGEPAIAQTGVLGNKFTVSRFFEPISCVEFDSQKRVAVVSGKGMEGVRLSLPQDQVMSILGEPHAIYPASAMALHYSRPGGENLFRARIVEIGPDDRVSSVVRYQFYD